MIQRINDFDIPTFPQVGDADIWMLHIWKNYTIHYMIDNQLLAIKHVSKWSCDQFSFCPKFAVETDKFLLVWPGEECPSLPDFDDNPREQLSNDFFDAEEDLFFFSNNLDELKSIVTALYIVEKKQKEQENSDQ